MPWFRDTYADAVRDCGYALRPNEKLVALVYADHAGDPENPGNELSWVSWGRLSEQTGIRSKDALNRAVRHLEKRGWLQLVEARKQHRSPRYRLAIPPNPEVRETYVWEDSEVREADDSPVDNPLRGTGDVPLSDSSGTSHGHLNSPEVRETTPEVRETTPRGTPDVPDPSTDPSTTDNPPALNPQPQDARKPTCHHPRITIDGDCMHCGEGNCCRLCSQLARNTRGKVLACYLHNEHLEAS